MRLHTEKVRSLLTEGSFKKLFIEELGWDNFNAVLEVSLDGVEFRLSAVAEKRGVQIFQCGPEPGGRLPEYQTRRKIDRQLTKSAQEHLIIFTDLECLRQVWQWVARQPGRPAACREYHFQRGQSGDVIIQKLKAISFTLRDEEALHLDGVVFKLRDAFDRDKVTKKFYDRFKTEHASFLKFIQGIPDEGLERWYTSVMIDRLMFIYFIQKKGFLNDDADYLQTKLRESHRRRKDRFYREVLCPLFFEGFAKRESERSKRINELLGKIPYLNGGLFLKHPIEELHGETIDIPDKAFGKLFAFFDQYEWHLDDRPIAKGNEINPDVLGYIFEKYINQKELGAYYTKEDITGYISKNTIIPCLFDTARKECKIAFEGEQSVWKLLQADPDRYIYEAVRRGVIDNEGDVTPESKLPDFVRKGMHDPKARMFEKRYSLGDALLSDEHGNKFTLPTETWREYVDRRKRCLELRQRLQAGEVREINDLITYNLDIIQFAQDVLENCEGPDLLNAFWKAINKVTVLDPACGSGAFLFAALNILEPLYEACLQRMEAFLQEWGEEGKKKHPNYSKLFNETLKRVSEHPNSKYFVYKTIIINNLYGVDILEEAVEICKLRLFLKLVAQLELGQTIEALPDIDFNIRSGNTLVGYATFDEVQKGVTSKLDFDNAMKRIEQKADDVDRLSTLFRKQQTEIGGEVTAKDKEQLRKRLKVLEDELNRYLANEYGVNADNKATNEKWLSSHKPFHWFIEFYGIIKHGGFDVVIGNPPYVEYAKVKETYTIKGIGSEECGNLYAYAVERSLKVMNRRGMFGMILPISFVSSERMEKIRIFTSGKSSSAWLINFAIRPQPLFPEIMQRHTISILRAGDNLDCLISTRYNRWVAAERDLLFSKLQLENVVELQRLSVIEKISDTCAHSILLKLFSNRKTSLLNLAFPEREELYFHDSGESYWTKCSWDKPFAFRNGRRVDASQWFSLDVPSEYRPFLYLFLNSNLMYFLWTVYTDCRHMTKGFIDKVPLPTNREVSKDLIEKVRGAYIENTTYFEKRKGYKSPEIKVQKFKPIIDEIDRVLAEHYGFTDEELDFIINYDIKYRMGRDAGEEE